MAGIASFVIAMSIGSSVTVIGLYVRRPVLAHNDAVVVSPVPNISRA